MNNKAIPIFVISITSFAVWNFLESLDKISGYTPIFLILLSISAFVYSSYKLLLDIKFENIYIKYTFILFIGYEFIIIFRGLSFSYQFLIDMLMSQITFWPLIVPLFIFFDKKISTLVLLIKYIYFIGVFFLLVNLLMPNLLLQRLTAESIIGLALSSGFVLMNASYLGSRKVNISFLVLFISLLSVIYLGRRSVIVTISGYIIASYILNITSKTKSLLFRFFPIIIGVLFFLLFSFSNLNTKLTQKMNERLTEDTRSELFGRYYLEMQDYMTFGKGMNGTYYSPISGYTDDDGVTFTEVDYRNVIENGYLQLMLTGGIVHIVLFLLVTLPAAFIGIIKSKNNFTRACGIFILLRLIDMLIYGLPSFSMSYILVWICVGVCFSAELREMSDESIHVEFQKNNLA
ncbi:MAG: O-antigen ligase family protein [Lentimicrobiaceae bacterium]|jgi:hypothetical protein